MSDRTAVILIVCALAGIIAALAGAAAGYLARRDNASYPTSLTRAAVTFAATLALINTMATSLVALANH